MTPSTDHKRVRLRAVLLQVVRAAMFASVLVAIHLHHQRRLAVAAASRLGSLSVEQVQEFFPAAKSLSEYNPSVEGQVVLDADGETLGYVLQTAPVSDDIVGYSGPTNLMLAFDTEDKIRGVSILHSEDTADHVRAIAESPTFLSTWNSLDRKSAIAIEQVDAVSGSTLTSIAIRQSITKRLGGEAPSLKFPDPLKTAELLPFFPTADSMRNIDGRIEVLDADQKALGFVLRSSPHADRILGYQGPTDLLLAFDTNSKLLGFSIRRSYDNEPYVGYVTEDYYFKSLFEGKTVDELALMDLKAEQVEGVSGATMSSLAVANGLIKTGQAERERLNAPVVIEQQWKPTYRDLGTLAVLVGGCVIGFTKLRGNKWVRYGWQTVLIVYLGFLNGDLVSQAFLAGAARNGVPWTSAFGLSCLTIAAFTIPLVSRQQIYCHQICPHGAIQQLVKRRIKWQWKLSPRVMRALSAIPIVLLGLVLVAALSLVSINLADVEPFDAYLFQVAGWGSLAIAVSGLIVSLFVPMAYCRFGCPTGALLNAFRWNARSDRWNARDTLAAAMVVVTVGVFLFVR